MKAKYSGKCHCGCSISFSPGAQITMSAGNTMISGHGVVKSQDAMYVQMENRINSCYHGESTLSWQELETWCLRLGYGALADLCRELINI
jgi:hypothetical protein